MRSISRSLALAPLAGAAVRTGGAPPLTVTAGAVQHSYTPAPVFVANNSGAGQG